MRVVTCEALCREGHRFRDGFDGSVWRGAGWKGAAYHVPRRGRRIRFPCDISGR